MLLRNFPSSKRTECGLLRHEMMPLLRRSNKKMPRNYIRWWQKLSEKQALHSSTFLHKSPSCSTWIATTRSGFHKQQIWWLDYIFTTMYVYSQKDTLQQELIYDRSPRTFSSIMLSSKLSNAISWGISTRFSTRYWIWREQTGQNGMVYSSTQIMKSGKRWWRRCKLKQTICRNVWMRWKILLDKLCYFQLCFFWTRL